MNYFRNRWTNLLFRNHYSVLYDNFTSVRNISIIYLFFILPAVYLILFYNFLSQVKKGQINKAFLKPFYSISELIFLFKNIRWKYRFFFYSFYRIFYYLIFHSFPLRSFILNEKINKSILCTFFIFVIFITLLILLLTLYDIRMSFSHRKMPRS